MIKKIFFPERINNYYIFSQRILALDLTFNKVYGTLMRAHRNKKTILKFLEASFDHANPETLIKALQTIKAEAGHCDEVELALPCSSAVFKNITIPFTDPKKIKLVLPFEIETLLPFPLQDAIVDAIINSENKEENSANVCAVAMRRSTMEDFIQPFLQAELRPTRVTIDALELYGLMQSIDTYKNQTGVSALINLNPHTTTIILLVDGALKTIRSITNEIDQELMRLDLGVAPKDLNDQTQKFFNAILFTIQAALKNEKINENISSIVLAGTGSQIAGIGPFIGNLFNCQCSILHPHKIVHNGTITLDHISSIPTQYTVSLATALSCPITQDFNLGREYQYEDELKLFKTRFYVAASLLICMFISFIVYSFLGIRKLKNEIDRSKQQVTTRLRKEFDLPLKKGKAASLTAVINETQQKLARKETIWFLLSPSNRFAYLQYLQELSTHIDRQALGLVIKRLSVKSDERNNQDTMVIEGTVKDYDALRTLEEDLQDTKLFDYVPKLQETKFTIPLVIDKSNKENV